MSPALLYARGARQVSVERPDMWNQILENALREPAACAGNRKAQKTRRGSPGEALKNEGRVLHHLCWADDLHEDMTNAIERLGMRWKEISLTIVPVPFTEYKGSGVWWRAWKHWARGGTIAAARRPACSTESPKPTPCFTRRRPCSAIPNCLSRSVSTPSTRRVHLSWCWRMGLHSVNIPRAAYLVACFACDRNQRSAGPST